MAGDEGSPGGHGPKPLLHQECTSCKKAITDRFYLKAMEHYWHEDCLKCSCCDCRLGEVGSTLFSKANLLLCRRDYLRLFGTTGYCSACKKMIPAFEMVMRAKNNVYHLECFACQQCMHRFCVGDRFYLADNKILCELDYEERVMFANLGTNVSGAAGNISNNNNNIPNGNANSNNTTNPNNNCSNSNNNNNNHHLNHTGIPNGIPGAAGLAGGGMGGGVGLAGGANAMGPSLNSFGFGGYNALHQIKRQTQSLSDDVSSGYGSPSPGSL